MMKAAKRYSWGNITVTFEITRSVSISESVAILAAHEEILAALEKLALLTEQTKEEKGE